MKLAQVQLAAYEKLLYADSRPCSRSQKIGTLQRRWNHHVLQNTRPFRLGVIGSGPAGFYTAYRVMTRNENAVVDMFEQLPAPYGLVRYGVAPDHPEVKKCQDKFAEIAGSPRFNFIGNIDIGKDLPLSLLKPHYDAILFAYGASQDRKLGLPGEDSLQGIYSARAFVGWYNGLPQYKNLAPDLDSGEEAIVIGQGNVALDVARTLLSNVDKLRKTDIAEQALDTLSKSRVKTVRVVGRRGPLQASFTIKEVRELLTLPGVGFTPIDTSLFPQDVAQLPRTQKRLTQLLFKGSSMPATSHPSKSWSLDFLLSPQSFNPKPDSTTDLSGSLNSINFSRNALRGAASEHLSPSASVVGTNEQITLPASLAFRSIGYESLPIPGMYTDMDLHSGLPPDPDFLVPFDTNRGTIPNDPYGRVLAPFPFNPNQNQNLAQSASHIAPALPNDPHKRSINPSHSTSNSRSDDKVKQPQRHVPGLYCAGWVKRGPTGVIASTMEDAFATAEAMIQDWESGDVDFLSTTTKEGTDVPRGWDALGPIAKNRGLRAVSWRDWLRIDEAEKERGRARGKDREKFRSVEDMLAVLD